MINAKYKVYYEYTGPTKCDPLRRELSKDDIRYNLGRFPDELGTALWMDDAAPTITLEEEHLPEHYIVISVRSPVDDNRYDSGLKAALNGLDLFAEELVRAIE